MRILVAGDWYSDVHEEGVYQAYQKLGHEVFRFTWHQYFQTAPVSFPLVAKIETIWRKLQDKFIVGPILYRINCDFIKKIDECKPDLISIYRGTHITKITLRTIKKRFPECRLVSHNEDDPFTEGHPCWLWRNFLASIPEYDLVLAHRLRNINEYKQAGAKNVKFLRSWYAPERTHAVDLTEDEKFKFECDVVFAGHFEDDGRIDKLEEIVRQGFKLRIYGPGKYWDPILRDSELLQHLVPVQMLWGEDYNRALCGAKVALCFFSKLNCDTYTRRCFEIPATQTVLLSEYSDELATLYQEGVEADFFKSKEELIRKLHRYVDNDAFRTSVALGGYLRVIADGHDVVSRMRQVLEWSEQIRGN